MLKVVQRSDCNIRNLINKKVNKSPFNNEKCIMIMSMNSRTNSISPVANSAR